MENDAQTSGGQKKGGMRVKEAKDFPSVSKIDQALSDIIKESEKQKQRQKRKRGGGPASVAGTEVFEEDTDVMPATKRGELQSVRLGEVERHFRRGFLQKAFIRNDPDASNWEAVSKFATFSSVDNIESFSTVVQNIADRNIRSHNGHFQKMDIMAVERKNENKNRASASRSVPRPVVSNDADASTHFPGLDGDNEDDNGGESAAQGGIGAAEGGGQKKNVSTSKRQQRRKDAKEAKEQEQQRQQQKQPTQPMPKDDKMKQQRREAKQKEARAQLDQDMEDYFNEPDGVELDSNEPIRSS